MLKLNMALKYMNFEKFYQMFGKVDEVAFKSHLKRLTPRVLKS